ncbi:Hypothetical predicted protein [Octopus vulgaris]|uniref:Uncharacterized protein n=1 Tax=Octopus vulgaris TaxID=6645 RepID=A0AA36B3L1_OCTVU|nr:Hypothetical predicted protein [Octopus vulgaris]
MLHKFAENKQLEDDVLESESEYSDALDKNYVANTGGSNTSDASSTDKDKQLVARGHKRQCSSPAPTAPSSLAPTASTSNTWSYTVTNPPNFPFTATPGLKIELNTNTIGEAIDQFLTEEFWTVLIEETNAYAMQILDQ